MTTSLCVLGAEKKPMSEASKDRIVTAATVAGGIAGSLLSRTSGHPLLGLLGGFGLGRNVARVAVKEITLRRGIENLGGHAIATAGALAVPSSVSWLGYVAGAVGTSLVLHRDDDLLERIDESILGRLSSIGGSPSLDSVRAGKAVIKQGDKGSAVEYVQALVGVVADGNFGPKTKSAVESFQLARGLSADGVVGRETMSALDALAGGTGGVARLDFSDDTKPPGTTPTTMIPRRDTPTPTQPPAGTMSSLPPTKTGPNDVADAGPVDGERKEMLIKAGLLGAGAIALGTGLFLMFK